MDQTKQYILLLACCISILQSCSYHGKTELTIINELQDCEEENIFYRILYLKGEPHRLESKRDSLVLLFFVDSLSSKANYDLFFPPISDKRLEFRVEGFFLKDKVDRNISYGCPGSSKFQITRVLEVSDVTLKKNYPIKYE